MADKTRVLVVEDDDTFRELLRRQLQKLGYEVALASDGQEGLEALQRELPDVVLSDLRMPRLSGLELLAEVHGRWPELPFIVLSGAGLFGDAVEALKLGAWDYLTKPVEDDAVLIHAIDAAVERAWLHKENERQRERLVTINRRLADSLAQLQEDERAGRQLQQDLLPPNTLRLGSFRLTRELLPSAYLSGDGLDAFAIDTYRWGFYLADVAGHGVPSALVAVMVHALVDRIIEEARAKGELPKPGAMLARLNEVLRQEDTDHHVTLFVGVVDEVEGTLTVANAGTFPPPLLVTGGRVEALDLPGVPLGLVDGAEYLERRLALASDARLVAYTDGLLDALGGPTPTTLDSAAKAALESVTAQGFLQAVGLDRDRPRPDDVAVLVLARGGHDEIRA